jgi:PAS domain-containing protein
MLAIKEFLHSNNVHSALILSLGAAACACLGLLVHTLVKRKNLNRYVRLSSPSPESVKKTASADYTNVYPPSQRHVLREISPGFSSNNVDLSASPRLLLRLDQDYRYANPAAYNFTGFSVDEIKRLGAFPDYAKLSGVPLPVPLKNFDLDAALPRPYRPFRWAYHQTMCKLSFTFTLY